MGSLLISSKPRTKSLSKTTLNRQTEYQKKKDSERERERENLFLYLGEKEVIG